MVGVSPAAANDAGMLTSSLRLVRVEVDGDAPANRSPAQELEGAEDIAVHLLPAAGLLRHLEVRGEWGRAGEALPLAVSALQG